jgi:hypothetical protein
VENKQPNTVWNKQKEYCSTKIAYFACENDTRACWNHNWACQNHTHACASHTRAYENHTLRAEITFVRVEITLGRVFWKIERVLAKNTFKNRHEWVWFSYANVSFSHVCMSIRHAIYYCVYRYRNSASEKESIEFGHNLLKHSRGMFCATHKFKLFFALITV